MRNLPCVPFLVCALTAVAVPVWAAPPANTLPAQPAPATPGDQAEKILPDLAALLQKCIVIEGTVTEKELLTASRLDAVKQETEPRKKFEALAAGMDCMVTEQGGVLVLQRKYTTFDALPFVPFEETLATSRNMTQLLAPYDTQKVFMGAASQEGTYAAQFIKSVQNEDHAKLYDGVLLSSLSAEQQQQCRLLTYFNYFRGDVERHALEEADINSVSGSDAVFYLRSLPKKNTLVFGFEYPASDGALQRRPLSSPTASYLRGSYLYFPLWGYDAGGQDSEGEKLASTTLPFQTGLPKILTAETLQTLCERLNSSSATKFSVDKVLERRKVTIAGMQYSDPLAIARAVSTLLQLRLVHTSDKPQNQYHLVSITPRADKEEARVQAMHDAIPAMLWRVIPHDALPPHPLPGNRPEPDWMIAERYEAQDRQRLSQLRAAIVKQLRTIVEPRLRLDKQTLLVAEAGENARDLLGLLLLVDMLEASRAFPKRQIPDSISNYDKLYLSCGTMRDKQGNPILDSDGKYIYQIVFGPSKETIHTAVSMILRFPTSKPIE